MRILKRSAGTGPVLFILLFTACVTMSFGARAFAQAGGTLTLLGQIDLSPSQIRNSDIWGWVDPQTNHEYAIVGEWTGQRVYIVQVTDPTNPVIVTIMTSTIGFDVKTWGNYLYLVDGDGSGTDGEIYDISDPSNPVFAGNFESAHNIFIDNDGIMYNSFSGLHLFDVAANPTDPVFMWSDGLTGGHDATAVGSRLYDFHGSNGTFIYQIGPSTVPTPNLLGQLPVNSGIVYNHSGWPSADGNYLYVNDELGPSGTPDITVWDISDPAVPFLVDSYTDPNATVHNSIRVGNFLYCSFYTAGVRVFDVSDPLNMVLADEYDTAPAFTGNGVFEGCWGIYPLAPSGNIYASDMQNGLFVFSFEPHPTGIPSDAPARFVLNQNHPNPFNPTTTISYDLNDAAYVTLTVFDGLGRPVRTLVNGAQTAGPQSVRWDGRDDAGQPVTSGVYFYRLRAGGESSSRRMVFLK
jgi:choice-of-anchor B domain-containing protein